MCLIVWKEGEDANFSNRKFRNMIHRNRDGVGIMVRDNGRVIVEKTVGTAKEKFQLWKKYRDHENYALHARFTTQGLTNMDNCHPFYLLNIDDGDPIDLAMMHNGTVPNTPEVDKDMSDTWHFVEYILKPLAKSNLDMLWNSAEFHHWIEKSIGNSKLLFMRSDDAEEHSTLILNYTKGVEEEGCWLSNTYSTNNPPKKPLAATTTGTTKPFGKATKDAPTTVIDSGINNNTVDKILDSAHNVLSQENNQCDAYYDQVMNAYRENTFTNHKMKGQLYLPDYAKDSKVINIKDAGIKLKFNDLSEEDQFYMENALYILQGGSINQVKEFIQGEPEYAADMIGMLHNQDISYETIMANFKSDEGMDQMIDIIRHIVSSHQSLITTRATHSA